MSEEARMQQEKINKLKAKKTIEFEHNLTNMLIHLYNGKQCNEYIKEYKTILDSVKLQFNSILYLADMDQEKFRAPKSRTGHQIPQ